MQITGPVVGNVHTRKLILVVSLLAWVGEELAKLFSQLGLQVRLQGFGAAWQASRSREQTFAGETCFIGSLVE